ncbi:hypothetical protein [Tenacibaculum agarivorans]|uniref:hypothetical protein n=1 Tax=Tenacibaculum agarivorans TaxID=1908389 RepID=UPI00094B8014|nr:hypothetical protein [Tenacibaculum agarivorans]
MCKINFKIQYTDADGDNLQAAQGRYKLKSATTFINFNINVSNPQTPDITTHGEYDLEVRVQDTGGLWSEWFASSFKVSENCGGSTAEFQHVIGVGDCKTIPKASNTTDIWVDMSNGQPNVIDRLDRVYTDEAMTILFNEGSGGLITTFRVGVRSSVSTEILWINTVFSIENGVITEVIDCDGGNPGGGSSGGQVTTGTINTGCDSGMVVTINVPPGETKTISVTKSGQANYIGGNQSGITADVMIGRDVTNKVITETTSFGLVLDAETGNEQAQSTITLSVQGGRSYTLTRKHQSNPNFC